MRSIHFKTVIFVAALAGSLFAGAIRAQQDVKVTHTSLKAGDMAPDFTLKYFDGKDLKDVSLSEYRGKKNVVLGFFIFAFTGG